MSNSDYSAMAGGASGPAGRELGTSVDSEVGIGPRVEVARAGDLALAGDIRLDNRAELVAQLGLPPEAVGTDAHLVLAAYDRWGEQAVARLYGDFAFGLWDPRRRVLLCGRDALGVRPLYYYLSPRTFAFAGDAATLLRLPDVPRRLNPDAITDFLAATFDDKASTGYIDVARLPPGQAVAVDRSRHRFLVHWTPDPITELRLGGDGEYEEAFRSALTTAVRSRLGAGPVGVSLSGGLDSTAITCLAGAAGARPLVAYTAVFGKDRVSDERAWAEAAVAASGATARHCHPERTSPLADWDGSPWKGPSPECAPQVSVCKVTLEAAAEDGVGVVLHGFAGDSVVSHGLTYLTELVGSRHFVQAAREIEAVARRNGKRRRAVWMAHAVGPFVPRGMAGALRATGLRGRAPAPAPELLRPELRSTPPSARRAARTVRQHHAADVSAGILPAVMEASRRVDAVVGVERRFPYLDRRLVELCLSLPGDQKLRNGWTRSIMRRSLDGTMPELVRQRTSKGNLSPAFERSLVTTDSALLDSVASGPGRLIEWVDPAALTALRQRCDAGGTSRDWFTLWRAAVAAQWLSHHGFDDDRRRDCGTTA